jgi:hypothetical protein
VKETIHRLAGERLGVLPEGDHRHVPQSWDAREPAPSEAAPARVELPPPPGGALGDTQVIVEVDEFAAPVRPLPSERTIAPPTPSVLDVRATLLLLLMVFLAGLLMIAINGARP